MLNGDPVGAITRTIERLVYKNRKILGFSDRDANSNLVNIEWWSMRRSDCLENVGDLLSTVIVNYMLSIRTKTMRPSGNDRFFASIGSVLGMGINDTVVWGSGFLNDSPAQIIRPRIKRLDIRAVRGPCTREVLLNRGYDCPEIYGDPAILTPWAYPRKSECGNGVGLVCHYAADKSAFDCCAGVQPISPLVSNFRSFIDEIISKELIVSSSLHGIILAEAYGVPAVLLADNRKNFDLFKYRDWYESTGRKCPNPAESIDEAIHQAHQRVPDLSDLQQGLLESFPYEIFA